MPDKPADVIAIDGPVGSGKTAAGIRLAERLGSRFLDTGQMYRAATLAAIRANLDFADEPALVELVRSMRFNLVPADGAVSRILVDGEDVTDHLRDPKVDVWVSVLSAVAGVRVLMVDEQRRIAEGGQVVMAGRDIGTVVLPDAALKIYLTASPEVRARRRHAEIAESGGRATYSEILESVRRRDALDTNRDASPLKPADDARVLDTSEMGLDEVVELLLAMAGGSC